MAKARTKRIKRVKSELVRRLQAGFNRPGGLFCSNRELMMRYGISYHTAHRLIHELEDEGYLHCVPSSGTYVAIPNQGFDSVTFYCYRDAEETNFGGILSAHLTTAFNREDIPFKVIESACFDSYIEGSYNIMWGQDYDLRKIAGHPQYSLMIDCEPEAGVNAIFTDSISIDYRDIGLRCGAILRNNYQCAKLAILAGPSAETPYHDLVDGVMAVYPDATLTYQGDWEEWSALKSLAKFTKDEHDGFFSVGNSGVRAIRKLYGYRIPIVAHGDARQLEADRADNGVPIPWEEIAEMAVRLYRLRSEGKADAGHHCIIKTDKLLREESLNCAS